MKHSTSRHRRFSIGVVAYRDLADLARGVIAAYAREADFHVIDKPFDEGLEAAAALDREHRLDAVVSAGASGQALRQRLRCPVSLINVTGYDVLNAVVRARQISTRAAVFTFAGMNINLEQTKSLLNLDLIQVPYLRLADIATRLRELYSEGVRVAIGSSVVKEEAARLGMHGIFIHSAHSVTLAVEDAIATSRSAASLMRRERELRAVIDNIDEGVAAVNVDGIVTALNPAMASILGIEENQQGDLDFHAAAPQFKLRDTLRGQGGEGAQVVSFRDRLWVTHRAAIRPDRGGIAGAIDGAVLTVQPAARVQRAEQRLRSSRNTLPVKTLLDDIAGESAAIKQAKAVALRYARSNSPVLIEGATGTGKELFAQGIHNASLRRGEPFVAVNCAAIPESLIESELFGYEEGAFTGARRGGKEGLFERAHGGSLFLDEIGDLPISMQARLLRVLQEREVLRVGATQPIAIDVRLISATHHDLHAAVSRGAFRQDLLYRLDVLGLRVPPLKSRPEDIETIARALFTRHQPAYEGALWKQVVLPVLKKMKTHDWPGNVRELASVIERAAVLGSDAAWADASDLNLKYPEIPDPVQEALRKAQGRHGQAATALGISRTTLWRRLKKSFV